MSSPHYLGYIGSVWNNLSNEDKERLGETWKAFEQVVASNYQRFSEVGLNIALDNLVQYGTQRWLPHAFDDATFIKQPAIFTSSQDLSQGIDLSSKYLVKIAVNEETPIEVDIRGVAPGATTVPEIISILNLAFGFDFARTVFEGSVIRLFSNITGPTASITFLVPSDPLKDASEYVFGILQSEMPFVAPEFPWVYNSSYSKIHSIPELRDGIRDESMNLVLVENVDYVYEVDTGFVRFKVEPPKLLWAKRTLFDEEAPWNNFGFLMSIYQKNKPTYLSVVQGLWYAFWNGPKPSSLRNALYLLFGLPTAQEDSTVTNVTINFVETTGVSGITRQFPIPAGLSAIVTIGQVVPRFTPLVSGIEIIDKISQPGFVKNELGRFGIRDFLTDTATVGTDPNTDESKAIRLLEEHLFLPQISSDAFISSDIDIGNIELFLKGVKQLNKTFIFQVIVGEFRDPMVVNDKTTFDINIDVTPNLDSNQTTFIQNPDLDNYETVDNEALNLDSDSMLAKESVSIDVYQGVTLIDSFNA